MSIFIFFSTFIAYVITLAPSITVGDSGEFCAASVILGLPHSPGYPLYCLIGKIFTLVIPWGSYAIRVNLASAFFASLCVTLLYRYLYQCLVQINRNTGESGSWQDTAIASVSVLSLAFTRAFWQAAIQSEVFALNAFFVAAILMALAYERYILVAFLFGLGLGNHHTLVMLAPFIFLAVYKEKALSTRNTFIWALFFSLGFSVYAYLVIRSYKNPGLDWGNPETLHNLWRVVSRADYGSLSLTVGEKLPRTISTAAHQVMRFSFTLNTQFSYLLLAFGLYGWYEAIKGRYRFSKELLVTWLLLGPGFILLANLPFNSQSEGILERFFIIVNVLWVLPVAWGIKNVLTRISGEVQTPLFSWLKNILAGIVLANLLVLSAQAYPVVNWRHYFLAYDYGRNLLRTISKNAVLFMDGGDDTFYSLAYFTFAERNRGDIELHDRGGLVFKNIYGSDFRGLSLDEKEKRRNNVEKEYYMKKKVYFSTFNGEILPGVALKADGILYTPAVAPPQPDFVVAEPLLANAWWVYSLRSVYNARYRDYRSNALAPIYTFFAAYHHKERALGFWRYSYTRWPEVLWVQTNVLHTLTLYAYKAFSIGSLDQAQTIYTAITELFPRDTSAWVNLGVIYEKMGKPDQSKQSYLQAISIDPQNKDAYYNLSVIYWKENKWDEVVKNLKLLLKIDPQDMRARYYLPLAEQKANEE